MTDDAKERFRPERPFERLETDMQRLHEDMIKQDRRFVLAFAVMIALMVMFLGVLIRAPA